MLSRSRAGWLVAAAALLPVLSGAGELQGRGGTWELGANVGLTALDGGFDAGFLGYTLGTNSKVPPNNPDNLDSIVPVVGMRAAYNATRYFAVELSVESGTAEVGTESTFPVVEDFTLPAQVRTRQFAEQTAAVPGMRAAIESLEYDYVNAGLTSIFNFNNRLTSRWVFYGVLGGGAFTLNADTGAWNDCNPQVIPNHPAAIAFNPSTIDPNRFPGTDPFIDNPNRIFVESGCGRTFPIGTLIGSTMVLGTTFQSANPLLDSEVPQNDPRRQDPSYSVDPVTTQVFLQGAAQWDNPPGQLSDRGYRSLGKIRSIDAPYYTAGVGARWHFKPRQAVRIDIRRHWAETINKNMNVVTVGYSFTAGRGRSRTMEVPDVLPTSGEAEAAEDAVPPPGEAEEGEGADPGDPPAR